MKVFIKVLRGDGCVLDVQENMKILDVKNLIQQELKVPLSQQVLLLMGKTLTDDQTIGSYNKIKEGSKIHLVIKKADNLQDVLSRFLLRYYNEKQTKMILSEFMKDFHEKVQNLSLDDLERIATTYLSDENSL